MNTEETVSVTCTVSGGDLPINFMWLLNRMPIERDLEVLTEKRGKRINVLMIDSLQAKHAGNYTCRAENFAASAEHTSELIVNGSSTHQHHCFLLIVMFLCIISRLSLYSASPFGQGFSLVFSLLAILLLTLLFPKMFIPSIQTNGCSHAEDCSIRFWYGAFELR